MSDDLLDNMSLSDDEMLDSLADDMLMEMEQEQTPSVPVSPSWAAPVAARPTAPNAMPDLSQMMSQMMPMMSQMLGGNANPMFGGANTLQQPPVSWQELVRRHVPADEQQDWLTTIDSDATKLQIASSKRQLSKPPSRSYNPKPATLPSVYLQANTLLGNLLSEAVRAAQLEQNARWREMREDLVPQLDKSGMTKVFEDRFKQLLRQRVENDPDFQAQKDSERYSNITTALFA